MYKFVYLEKKVIIIIEVQCLFFFCKNITQHKHYQDLEDETLLIKDVSFARCSGESRSKNGCRNDSESVIRRFGS